MKKIFFVLVFFFVLFSGWNLFILNYSKFFKQEEEYVNRIDDVLQNKPEIILLGDSHIESLKYLDLSKNVGNLAYGADGIKEMYLKTLLTVRFNPNLRYVLISTEPQIFNKGISPNSGFFNKYLMELPKGRSMYDKTFLDLLVEKVPLFNDNYIKYYLNKIYNSLKGSATISEASEWYDLDINKQNEIAKSLGASDHSKIMSSAEEIVYFEELIKLLKKQGITVIGVRFPVTTKYYSQLDPDDLNNVDRFMKQLSLNKNLDYSNYFISNSYFKDPDHLNNIGLEKLVPIIEKDTGLELVEISNK